MRASASVMFCITGTKFPILAVKRRSGLLWLPVLKFQFMSAGLDTEAAWQKGLAGQQMFTPWQPGNREMGGASQGNTFFQTYSSDSDCLSDLAPPQDNKTDVPPP